MGESSLSRSESEDDEVYTHRSFTGTLLGRAESVGTAPECDLVGESLRGGLPRFLPLSGRDRLGVSVGLSTSRSTPSLLSRGGSFWASPFWLPYCGGSFLGLLRASV